MEFTNSSSLGPSSSSALNGPNMPEFPNTDDRNDQANLSGLPSLPATSDLNQKQIQIDDQVQTSGAALSDLNILTSEDYNDQAPSSRADSNLTEANPDLCLSASTTMAECDEEMVDHDNLILDHHDGDGNPKASPNPENDHPNVANPVVAELMEKVYTLDREVSSLLRGCQFGLVGNKLDSWLWLRVRILSHPKY